MRHCAAAHLKALLAGVFLVWKRHGDHEFFDLAHAGQQGSRQNLVIRPHAPDQFSKDHPVNQTMRMVGNDDYRAFLGDACNLLSRRLQLDLHDPKRLRPKRLTFGRTQPFKAAHHVQQRQFTCHPLQRADGVGFPRIGERVGVA